jgi:hypothetical protein
MERKLHEEPQFDMDTLNQKCEAWKAHSASKVVLEWSTGTGPNVFYFPAGERGLGVKWTVAVETYNYNEIYADFIEHTLLPRLQDAIQSSGLAATVMCVDLQPLQIQRQRRRQIERAQTAATGEHASGHH